ncbi:MAG: phospholipase D-like domain-containing protein [Sulfuricaulis sp.]|nr:phospholipase D-like domain-containing protein [Sulfuricaulis sp.]
MPYAGLTQPPPSRSCALLRATAEVRRMAVAACCLLALAGCASLPDAAREMEMPHAQAVEFDNARGPVSASKSAAILEELKSKSGDIDILQKHLALEQEINADSPLVLGNKLVLLQDGPATYRAMFAAIRQAKDHISLETYIFEDDDIGRQFADLLLERQAAGVQVNLIYDSVGCLHTPKEFFERLSTAGIQVLEYNPINPLAGKKKEWLLNNRDHRKLLVVDGRIAFIGGINISESYSSGPSAKSAKKKGVSTVGWRDTHLQIEGPVVAEFQKLFMDTWTEQKGRPLARKIYFPKLSKQGDEIVRAIGSASADPHSLIYLTLLSAIAHAEQRVYLTNAYFVPDPQFLKSLIDAARRGAVST